MIVALLIVIIAILLFGAAAVRGFLSNTLATGLVFLVILLVLGFAKTQYDKHAATQRHDQDIIDSKRLTLEAVARDIKKPQSSLLDVVAYAADDDFEMCGTIAGTSGFGGSDGRQRWISNGGGRFEYEGPSNKNDFDDRVALLCTYNHTAAMMKE